MRIKSFLIVFAGVLVLAFMSAGCSQTVTEPDSAAKDLEQMARDMFAAYAEQDIDKCLSFMAEDIESIGSDGTTMKGKEAFRKDYEDTLKNIPDLTMDLENVFASDNYVCTQATIRGTYAGVGEGEEALAGKPISSRGAIISEVRDGKIVRSYVYYDNAVILNQLGILQLPPQGQQ